MNLAAYLQMKVKTLDEYTPACQQRQKEQERKKAKKLDRNCENANRAKHAQAVERYREAMRGTWATTHELETRLGMGRATCGPNLRKWEEMGLVERRKVGPPDKWNRRKGYEWRWMK